MLTRTRALPCLMPCIRMHTPSTRHRPPRTRHALRGLGLDSRLESDVLKKYDANRSGPHGQKTPRSSARAPRAVAAGSGWHGTLRAKRSSAHSARPPPHSGRPPPHRPLPTSAPRCWRGLPAPKRPFTTGRSGRLDILEFNKLVLDMRLERDDPMGSSQQAIRAPTADQPLGGYGGYGYGGGYGGQAALPLPHGGAADQPLLGGGQSAGVSPDIPLGSRGSRGSLQARPGVAPADQPLGLAGGRAGVAPEHRVTADEPLPIGGRSGFAPGYRPEADQPLGGRAGYAPTYRTGLN